MQSCISTFASGIHGGSGNALGSADLTAASGVAWSPSTSACPLPTCRRWLTTILDHDVATTGWPRSLIQLVALVQVVGAWPPLCGCDQGDLLVETRDLLEWQVLI
jgi:hypothetical protein